jgi:hypothetical protein
MSRIKSLVQLAFDTSIRPEARTGTQRLAIPHTFNEALAVPDAIFAVIQAMVRIFLGCLLFAMWGTLAMWLWSEIASVFLRFLVLVPVLVLFLFSFLALMAGISTMTKAVSLRRSS